MKRYVFKCTLLTDVILTSSISSEGKKKSLDYIPGNKFLGIAAKKLYDENNPATMDLFHNGSVCFGDATPNIGGLKSQKVPLDWFIEKGGGLSEKIYLNHTLTENNHKEFRERNIQLKQVRSGYFCPSSGHYLSLTQNFSLKSAYDKEKRKSKDGELFGYYSLPAGSEWIFYIDDRKGYYIDELRLSLVGKHTIGRSRSAEYGLTEIEFIKAEDLSLTNELKQGENILYASSNLCFFDHNGKTTAQPTIEELLGIKETGENTPIGEIIWEKSQVRTRNYQSRNTHRKNKDADKLIIERGSVFMVRISLNIDASLKTGALINEGFGEVLYNPPFLNSPLKLSKTTLEQKPQYVIKEDANDKQLLCFLNKLSTERSKQYQMNEDIKRFISLNKSVFRGISKSQWGTLRNYSKNLSRIEDFEQLVFHRSSGFLYKGQSESIWREKGRRKILESKMNDIKNEHPDRYLEYMVKLSNLMSKD